MSYPQGPLYSHSDSTTDPATGYVHTHAFYADAYGDYARTLDEERGPAFDRRVQTIYSSYAGVTETDVVQTTTPLDGAYESYGTHYTGTYDAYDHTATTADTVFRAGYSYTAFHSVDYVTGATVDSADTRWFYAGGYYEDTSSTYAGPGGTVSTAEGGYHPTT